MICENIYDKFKLTNPIYVVDIVTLNKDEPVLPTTYMSHTNSTLI
jgi:hypothetical protein